MTRAAILERTIDFDDAIRRIVSLEKENAELKERLKEHEKVGNEQFWRNVWSWNKKAEQLEYAKTIIKDLLDNSDEYARQRAMDFLEEIAE